MGHKVHPKIHRLPIIYTWDSKWFGKKRQISEFLQQEIQIRDFLAKKIKDAGVDGISVERTPKELTVTILAAKPGVIIGRGGQGLEEIRKKLERTFLKFKVKVKINVQEVK